MNDQKCQKILSIIVIFYEIGSYYIEKIWLGMCLRLNLERQHFIRTDARS